MGGFMMFLILIMVLGAIIGWYRARKDDSGAPASTMGQDLARVAGSLTGGKIAGRQILSNDDRSGSRRPNAARS